MDSLFHEDVQPVTCLVFLIRSSTLLNKLLFCFWQMSKDEDENEDEDYDEDEDEIQMRTRMRTMMRMRFG